MTACNKQDLSWALLGFRLGQLTEICRPESMSQEEDEELVGAVITNLTMSVENCGLLVAHQSLLLGLINGIAANWGRRDELVYDHGTSKPFALIYGDCLRIPGIVRQLAEAVGHISWFEIGILLGQSTGWCQAFFEVFDKRESCWIYRRRDELLLKLDVLGKTLEELSGLPDTDLPETMNEFFWQLLSDDTTMRRYPMHRWGWGWIESSLNDFEDGAEHPKWDNDESKIHEDLVETSQIAAFARVHKKTITRWLNADPLILPYSEGGGGKATLWQWSKVRDRITAKSRRDMPVEFPGNLQVQ